MRKFWFAVIDIALLMTISYANEESSNDDELDDEKEVLLGDMQLSNDQMNYLFSSDTNKRLALGSPFIRWPNATVFYEWDKLVDRKSRETVTEAMNYIQNVSCVRFKIKDDSSEHYVLIRAGTGCNSKVGMRKYKKQDLVIDEFCTKGTIIHELLHCLGFLHMHMSPERDDYITLNWPNIKEDFKNNFKQYMAHVSMFDTKYDLDSITHYSGQAYAKDKRAPTIIPKQPAPNMGQRKEMSVGDITRLNRMYNCPKLEASMIGVNGTTTKDTKNPTQFTNGATIKRVRLNKTTDNTSTTTDEPRTAQMESDMESNQNDTDTDTDTSDDENDMLLSEEQFDALFSLNAAKRNGLKSAFAHWPGAEVPFEIDPAFHPKYISTIYESMNYIMNRSCVRFAPRTPNNQNYVYITKGKGCSSEVGLKHTGKQLMNINGASCPRGKVIHEFLHTLGFLHMHTANERDNFIKVNWDNIVAGAEVNFQQFNAYVSMFSTPYDYGSIMHYSPYAFSRNKSIPTIAPMKAPPNGEKLGQRDAMSDGDVIRLNRMYKCEPAANTVDNPPAQSKSTSSEMENANRQQTQTSKPSIFGMFIFKIIWGN